MEHENVTALLTNFTEQQNLLLTQMADYYFHGREHFGSKIRLYDLGDAYFIMRKIASGYRLS